MPTLAVPNKMRRHPSRARKSPKKSGGALYERMKHLIGTIDGPGDLSTNPKYLEGYGRSRRP
jgi:hypothetical protein